MLREVTFIAKTFQAAICLGAVPREQFLVLVQVSSEPTPIVPEFLQSIKDIGVVVMPETKLQNILFCEAVRNVEFGLYVFCLVLPNASWEMTDSQNFWQLFDFLSH